MASSQSQRVIIITVQTASQGQHNSAALRAHRLKQDQVSIIIHRQLQKSNRTLIFIHSQVKYKIVIFFNIMSVNTLIPDIIAYLTNSTQLTARNLFLKVRFRQQLPTFVDFLAFVLVTPNINTQQAVQMVRVVQFIKELVLEADLYANLLLLSKICPILKSKHIISSKRTALQSKFKEWMVSSKSKIDYSNISTQNGKSIMEWIQKQNYLTFYIFHMNQHNLKKYEEIDIYFSQLEKQENSPFSQTQLQFLKTQMLTQYQKMNKIKYKQQTVTSIYQWLKEELKFAFTEPFDNACSLISIDTVCRVVRVDSNLASSVLIQACEHIVPFTRPSSYQSLLVLVDQILLASNAVSIIQVVLILVPTLFLKAIQPNTPLKTDLMALHLDFWMQAVSKRFVDSTLLMCINDWFQRILLFSNTPSETNQLQQLFKVQLMRKVKNKNIEDLKCIFAEKEMQKIEQVYRQIQIYHQILQKSNVSYFEAKSQKSSNQNIFNYQVSLLSSKQELMSMLDSIHNQQAGLKIYNVQSNQQLKIYSKKNSVARSDDEEDPIVHRVNYVINILGLFALKSEMKKEASQVVVFRQSTLMPPLPLFSSNQKLGSDGSCTNINDPYGLYIKARGQTLQINPIFIPINELNKKKVIKNKGMIIKTNSIEIGYIFGSNLGRRRLSLVITFGRPNQKISMSIDENSIKFTKAFNIQFENPKIKKQFRVELDIQKVSLYKVEGYHHLLRFIKPKILIRIQQKMGKECQMKQQIPLYLYNLIEWLEIPQSEQEIFNFKAQITSCWHKVYYTVRKLKQPELRIIFPYCKLDKKRTILIKMRFLLEIIFCKIYVVLDQAKIELINSDSQTVLLALLEMISQQDRQNQ